jgi:ankyrin repeat protein
MTTPQATPTADGRDSRASASSLPAAAIDLATRMFDAARENDVALLTQALTAGLPPNLTNAKGDTLLMLASYHGHLELVNLLLARGADPNVLNERGQSPLAGTVFKGEREIAEALLRGGADPYHGEPSARAAVEIFGVDRLIGAEAEGWGKMMDRLGMTKEGEVIQESSDRRATNGV